MRSRRVLFVNVPTYIGGAEVSLLTLMRNLPSERVTPYLITGGGGPLLDRARTVGIPSLTHEFTWFSRRRPWRYARSVYRFTRAVRERRIDIVHTNCDQSLRYALWSSRLTRVPYVSHVRDFVRTWFVPANVAVLNQAAFVVANSHATAQACSEAGVNQGRVVTIYNPIDVESFESIDDRAREWVRLRFAIPSDALVVGFVGQLQAMKGVGEFVGAACELVHAVPNVHFLLVGAPPPDQEQFAAGIQQQTLESGWAERFHFTGFQPELPPLMKAIDILAIPSWNEPFGRVAVEGMAAGCAVVGTNNGGLPEIITDAANGLLIPPRHVRALAAALLRLCRDRDLRARLVQRGSHTAQRFTVARHVETMLALYEQVFAKHFAG